MKDSLPLPYNSVDLREPEARKSVGFAFNLNLLPPRPVAWAVASLPRRGFPHLGQLILLEQVLYLYPAARKQRARCDHARAR